MKQKVLIGIMGVGIVAGLSIGLYTTFSKGKEPSISLQDIQSERKEIIKETTTKGETATSVVKNGSIYEKPPDKKEKNISLVEARAYMDEARKHFRDLEFMKGVESLQSIVNSVSNTEGGEALHQMYYEGSMIANLIPPSEDELLSGGHSENIEFDGMVGILNSIKDPENALLGALVLDDRYRAEIIIEQDSLNPIFDGGIKIVKQSTVTEGDILVGVKNLYKNAKTLHQIDFEIDGYRLSGYVIEFNDGFSKLYTILSTNKSNPPYKTIREWQAIYDRLEQK